MDAAPHPEIKEPPPGRPDLPRPFLFLLGLLLLFGAGFAGCALPQIVVLRDPLTPEEHLDLGVAYERKGELEAAIREYHSAVTKIPLANLHLGNAYFQRGDLGLAEKYYRRAIREEPEHADAYNNLAWLYFTKRENLREAEELALKAGELNPAKSSIYGDTLERIRELKKAGVQEP